MPKANPYALLLGAVLSLGAFALDPEEGRNTSKVCIEPLVGEALRALVDAAEAVTPVDEATQGNRGAKSVVLKPAFDTEVAKVHLERSGFTELRLLGQGSHGAVYEGMFGQRPVAVKYPSSPVFGILLPVEHQYLAEMARFVHGLRVDGTLAASAPQYFPSAELHLAPTSYGTPAAQILVMDRAQRSPEDARSAEPLSRWISAVPADPALGASLKYHLPRALEQLHAARIVHRDLKPSNVLVPQSLVPVIVDFGIAAHINRRANQLGDSPNVTSGTLAYMGPEQWDAELASPRMDVFAAKKLLLEVLVGQDMPGFFTEMLQTSPDPSRQENYPSARRWLRAPESKIGRLAIVLTTNVLRDGAELRAMVDLAENSNASDESFYQRMGFYLARETPERIVNELLCSKTLIARFPEGLGIDAALATAVVAAFPSVMRVHAKRRLVLLREGQFSTVKDPNLWGYEEELRARLEAWTPPAEPERNPF